MARYPPLWQQEGAYNAIQDRQLISTAWPGGGIQGGAITLSGTAMTASIAPGTCVVPLTATNGNELCYWDAAEVVTFTAAPGAGTSRIDLIVCQVHDDAVDTGGQNNFVFNVIAGTAAASPVAPATPVNAFALAQVTIPASVTNLSTATLLYYPRVLGGVPAGGAANTYLTKRSGSDYDTQCRCLRCQVSYSLQLGMPPVPTRTSPTAPPPGEQ